MIRNIFSVSALTLVSRLLGYARDVMLAAIIGAGALSDAFIVALRIPNQFRAIFGEGAVNASFVPAFATVAASQGRNAALVFADRIFAFLLIGLVGLTVVALVFMPGVVGLVAPGFVGDSVRFPLAVDLTRITFPYLFLISVVVLLGSVLNAVGRFVAYAAAQMLLSCGVISGLLLSAHFETPAHAAAWGIVAAGLLQLLVVAGDALRADVMLELRRPKVTEEVRLFWRNFVPATLGSAGSQVAVFADTIIASFLAAGAVSWLYYADRLNQLPVGVIGVAVGTVLISEMSRRIAAGDDAGARHAQLRAIELTLVFCLPAVAAFVLVPDTIIKALFMRGNFTEEAAMQSAAALAAYGLGLTALVLVRPLVVTFHARGDTRTPVIAVAAALAVNVSLKVALMQPLGHVGLAAATSAGVWINVGLLLWFGRRRELIGLDERARRVLPRLFLSFAALCATLLLARFAVQAAVPRLDHKIVLLVLMAAGGGAYGASLVLLFGREFIADLKRLRRGVTG